MISSDIGFYVAYTIPLRSKGVNQNFIKGWLKGDKSFEGRVRKEGAKIRLTVQRL
jgi:hypothetical protein